MNDKPEIVKILREEEKLGKLQSSQFSNYKESSYDYVDRAQKDGFSIDEPDEQQKINELETLEDIYQTIFENSAIGIMVTDKNERLISWNKYVEQLLGMESEDLSMKPVKMLYPLEEWKKIRSENIRQKGIQYHMDTKMVKKNGEIIYIDLSVSVLRNFKGEIIGSIGIISDVTKYKLMEKKLEESERKFRQLYEKAPVAYHTLSPDGIITDINERWCQSLGYTKEEVIGRLIFDFIAENERESAISSFEKKIESKKAYTGGHDRIYITKNGDKRTFVSHDFLCFDENNEVKSIYTTMEDVTERKQLEDSLYENEKKFRDLFENANDLIQSVDPSGKFIYVNKKWLETLGFKVNYPGLKSFKYHELAKKQMRGFSGILSFDVGDMNKALKVVNSVKIIKRAVSFGGVESLIEHPATSSHYGVPEDELKRAGVTPGLIRISVGIENVNDLINDLEQALKSTRLI